jgi:hypothetical protein
VIGHEQVPIDRLLSQIDIPGSGNHAAACLHGERIAPNMAGSEAAIGVELVE